MSIPFPPDLASSGSASLTTPTVVGFCNLWRDQRSLCGFRLRFHPLAGLMGELPILIGFVPPTVPAINSRCPTGHQLNEQYVR
jgi:hypothetical protein